MVWLSLGPERLILMMSAPSATAQSTASAIKLDGPLPWLLSTLYGLIFTLPSVLSAKMPVTCVPWP